MAGWQEEAQQEMWEGIAAQDRAAGLREEREHWTAVADGRATPRRDLYRAMSARFPGACDGDCARAVRRGDSILYTSHAPRGFKVFHEGCFPSSGGKTYLDEMRRLLALPADVQLAQLRRLRESLTARTGQPHDLYRTPRGIAVYPETMAATLGYARAEV